MYFDSRPKQYITTVSSQYTMPTNAKVRLLSKNGKYLGLMALWPIQQYFRFQSYLADERMIMKISAQWNES